MLNDLSDRLIRIIDWFIPAELRINTANLWRARIFVISHLLGPCSAIAILGFLYYALPAHDWVFWTICVLCGAFWLLPFALRFSRTLMWLALFSFCDLTFVSVFGSYFYGGVSSPFLPWCLAALLIGFFYIGDRPLLWCSAFYRSPCRLLCGLCGERLVPGARAAERALHGGNDLGFVRHPLHLDDGDLLRLRHDRSVCAAPGNRKASSDRGKAAAGQRRGGTRQ